MSMFTIIETHNSDKTSIGYFSTREEASEFILNKKKEYKEKRYYLHLIKEKRGLPYYVAVRKKTRRSDDFWSWSIVKLTDRDDINAVLCDNELFCNLCDDKRKTQICIRMNDDEIEILKRLGNRYGVKPSTLIRCAIRQVFEKEIKKFERGMK